MDASWSSLFHILNPSHSERPGVASFFAGSEWEHIWIERKSHPTHLETAVHWAVNEGRDAIAVWGGDGTFSRVVNALADLDALDKMRVALIPAGTCNDFARDARLESWKKLVGGPAPIVERRVDLARMSHDLGTRIFVNNAGFGRRPEARREKRPNPVMDILRMRPEPIDIVARQGGSEKRAQMDALMAIVFNAPYFGGGMHFATDIHPDDARLDAFFVRDQSRFGLLWSFIRGRGGKEFQNRDTTRFSGERIDVSTAGEMYPQADGESASSGAVRKINFEVLPGALRLLVPGSNTPSEA